MWTSNRGLTGRTEEAAADQGTVTLGGDPAGVYLGGERRWVSLYAPGGYQWRPRAGDKVLVVKAGDHREAPCLVGRRVESEEELEPGAVRIQGGSGTALLSQAGVTLTGDTVALNGTVTVNGQNLENLIASIVSEILASLLG